jgi:hypothetical protein
VLAAVRGIATTEPFESAPSNPEDFIAPVDEGEALSLRAIQYRDPPLIPPVEEGHCRVTVRLNELLRAAVTLI